MEHGVFPFHGYAVKGPVADDDGQRCHGVQVFDIEVLDGPSLSSCRPNCVPSLNGCELGGGAWSGYGGLKSLIETYDTESAKDEP